MWRALLTGIVFQQRFIEGLIGGLRRDPFLLDLCGLNHFSFSATPLCPFIVTHPQERWWLGSNLANHTTLSLTSGTSNVLYAPLSHWKLSRDDQHDNVDIA